MNIKEIRIERTDDKKGFSPNGKNWFLIFQFDNNKRLGIELKPEMNLSEVIIEFIQFLNLLIKNNG